MSIEIPALCFGTRYHSLNRHSVVDLGTGEELATLGLVVASRIAMDCRRGQALKKARAKLLSIPVRRRIEMCVRGADHFENSTLECGGEQQSFSDYIDLLSRTSGLPITLAKATASRNAAALRMTEAVLSGLSRGLPLEILDTGIGEQAGVPVRLVPRFDALGCCMPNNSPGVHVTWLASLAFGFPVLLRPGSAEPFTPYRLIQGLIQAGFPEEVFGFYPSDHEGAARIPELTRGAIVFGSDGTVKQWANNPLVQIHGSGFSKLFIGEDRIEDWRSLIPELALNVAANSGRSCFAVSRIVVPRYGKEIAAALAEELAKYVPLPRDHAEAKLSALAMPKSGPSINAAINAGLKVGGAIDMSAPYQPDGRLVVFEGRTYLLPTVIFCDSNSHTLANREYLFPFTAVVEASNDTAFAEMGSTLSLAVYTNDPALKERARRSSARLVSINVNTSKLDRRQPHEENLFNLFFEGLSCVEEA
jgi:acyl-CoA reductase-like NAD-dependent aldehyde dehydrogenase